MRSILVYLVAAAAATGCATPATPPPAAGGPPAAAEASYDRLVRTARGLTEQGKSARAAELAAQAAAQEPGRPEAFVVWGLALAQAGDLGQSAEKYERARQNGGQDRRLFAELASVYDVAQRYDDAVRVYRDYLAAHPGDHELRSELALTLLLLQRYDQAVIELEAVVKARPDDLQAGQDLGYALLRAGEPAKAVARLEPVVAAEPARRDAALHLARAYAADGRAGRAVELLNRLLAAEPRDEAALRMRARLLLIVGQPADAARDYEALLGLVEPNDLAVRLGYAGVLIALDRVKEAAALIAAAERERPEHPLVRFRAAQVRWRKGERSALEPLAEFARANPTDVEAWRELGHAARRFKDKTLEGEAQAKLRVLGDLN